MHRDAVLSLPEGAFNLGTSESCNIQGLVIPRRAISVQAHPEFDEFIMGNVIETRRAQKVFDDNMAEDGLARTKHAHDGVQVFAGLLGYVLAF